MIHIIDLFKEPEHLLESIEWLEEQNINFSYLIGGQTVYKKSHIPQVLRSRRFNKKEDLRFVFKNEDDAILFKLRWV